MVSKVIDRSAVVPLSLQCLDIPIQIIGQSTFVELTSKPCPQGLRLFMDSCRQPVHGVICVVICHGLNGSEPLVDTPLHAGYIPIILCRVASAQCILIGQV